MAGLQLIKNISEKTFLFHSWKKLRLKIYKLGDAVKLIPENVNSLNLRVKLEVIVGVKHLNTLMKQ